MYYKVRRYFLIISIVGLAGFFITKNRQDKTINIEGENQTQQISSQNTINSKEIKPSAQDIQQDKIKEEPKQQISEKQYSEDNKENKVFYEEDIAFGNKDAKIVITEYFSYTCLHCADFHHNIMPELRKKYIDTGKIYYIFKEYIANRYDLDAGILAHCTIDRKKSLDIMFNIMEEQNNWLIPGNYRDILKNIGKKNDISQAEYEECLDNRDLQEYLINKSREITANPMIKGTPTIMINDQIYDQKYNIRDISKAIDMMLNEKSIEMDKNEAK